MECQGNRKLRIVTVAVILLACLGPAMVCAEDVEEGTVLLQEDAGETEAGDVLVHGATVEHDTALTNQTAETVRVVLVQVAVTDDLYESHRSFATRMEGLARQAVVDYNAELIIFPEYVNVFPLFDDYTDDIEHVSGFEELSAVVAGSRPLPEVLRREIMEDTPVLRRIWSTIAADLGVWILAGSAFVHNQDGTLTNRAWLFAPDGKLTYRQDKVYVTHFEESVLDLAPGEIEETRPFTIDGVTFGLTICRDGFFEAWERRFEDADVWIEIRANGEVWTEEVRRRFDTAMPERVREAGADMGVSTSLNGAFLDLLWQGPAYVVNGDGKRVRQSSVVDGTAMTAVTVGDID